MPSERALLALAVAAHAVWCEQMTEAGWRAGEIYDAHARRHDAIRPFAQLDAVDRRDAVLAAERLAVRLTAEMDYPRGPTREFTPGEMQIGLPVAAGPGSSISGMPSLTGHVISWIAAPGGELLESVTVRWSDGAITEHLPSLRDLRRR